LEEGLFLSPVVELSLASTLIYKLNNNILNTYNSNSKPYSKIKYKDNKLFLASIKKLDKSNNKFKGLLMEEELVEVV